MVRSNILLMVIIAVSTHWTGCVQEDARSDLKGPYLGQKPPGMTPEVFAPGIVSTNMNEDGGPVFTPDGREIFWRIGMAPHSVFLHMKQENGVWSEPETASFSGRYSDGGLCISPDGKRIFFASKRPFSGVEGLSRFHTWITEKTGGRWQEPVPAGEPIDHPDDYYTRVSVASCGTLIKQSGIPGGKGGRDLYECRFADGNYAAPVNLPGEVNTECNEYGPAISPDGSYIVFQSDDRPDSIGSIDLYVTFRREDGSWSRGINLGEGVNTEFVEHWPSLTPDGKYLFFSSDRPAGTRYGYSEQRKRLDEIKALFDFYYGEKHGGDFYWVDARVIEAVRPDGLNRPR